MNEPWIVKVSCSISSNLLISRNFLGIYYFQIKWKCNTKTWCRKQKAKGDENNSSSIFDDSKKKLYLTYSILFCRVTESVFTRWELKHH